MNKCILLLFNLRLKKVQFSLRVTLNIIITISKVIATADAKCPQEYEN